MSKSEASNSRNVEWTRYMVEMSLTEPEYEIPYDAYSIEDAMKETLHTDRLFVAYLPLGFYTMPMWPKNRSQWKTPYEGIFYYCVDCKKPCTCGAQVCMEFFLPALMDFLPLGVQRRREDLYPWSWLPRLRCHTCLAEAGEDDLRTLAYFPHAIFLERVIGAQISTALQQLSDSRSRELEKKCARNTRRCKACDRPMNIKKRKKKKRRAKQPHQDPFLGILYCSLTCKEYYDLMEILKQQHSSVKKNQHKQGTTGLFQLLELLDTFKQCKIDIHAALCWSNVCNRYRVAAKPCQNKGNMDIICQDCHKVAYCSTRCRSIDKRVQSHLCGCKWDDVFDTQLVILQEGI